LSELQKLNPTLARERIIAALGVYKLDFETTGKFLARNNPSSLDRANDEISPLTASFNMLNVDTRLPPDIHKDFSVLPFSADAEDDPGFPDENHVRFLAAAYMRTVKQGDERTSVFTSDRLKHGSIRAFLQRDRTFTAADRASIWRFVYLVAGGQSRRDGIQARSDIFRSKSGIMSIVVLPMPSILNCNGSFVDTTSSAVQRISVLALGLSR